MTTTKLLYKKKNKTKQQQQQQKKHVTTAATAAKLSLIKWACAISNLIAVIRFFNRSNANDFFGSKSNVRKKNKRRETNLRGNSRFTTTIKAEIRKTHIAGFHVLVQ